MGRRKKKVEDPLAKLRDQLMNDGENYKKSLLIEGLRNQYREEARKNLTEFLSKEKASAREIKIQADQLGIKDLNLHFTEIVLEELAKLIVGAH